MRDSTSWYSRVVAMVPKDAVAATAIDESEAEADVRELVTRITAALGVEARVDVREDDESLVATCTAAGNAPNGTGCGLNMYCNAGSCQICANGSPCVPSTAPCNLGAIQCADGGIACNDTGSNLSPRFDDGRKDEATLRAAKTN